MPKDPELVVRDVALLRADQPVRDAVAVLERSGLPALPVVDAQGHYAGVFGEREFLAAVFPGYVGALGGAAFVPRSLEEVLEKRSACASEHVGQHMNAEHVEVGEDFSDVQLAEVFLHHRVLVVPVVAGRRVVGVIPRSAFFQAVSRRFLGSRGIGA